MTRALVFETPGSLDLRAFTLMGVSVKPNAANPIGYFGTGLKYAVAVLTRLGAPPTVYVGGARYVFEVGEEDFRGAPVGVIALVEDRYAIAPNPRRELPFTTEYGRAWEPWQAYRELEANTRDEGGTTFVASDANVVIGEPGLTRIVVASEALIEIHEAEATGGDSVFLPPASEGFEGELRVLDAPSRFLYYRGMRAYTLPRPARRTYDIRAPLELTEDRTLKQPWWADYLIAKHVAGTADEKLVLDVIHAARDTYEGKLDYADSFEPSETVSAVVTREVTREVLVTPERADRTLYDTPVARFVAKAKKRSEPPPAPPPDAFERWPRPWRVEHGEGCEDPVLVDANGDVLTLAHPDASEAFLRTVAAAVNAYNVPTDADSLEG